MYICFRRWIQAVFCFIDTQNPSFGNSGNKDLCCSQKLDDIKPDNNATLGESGNGSEVDLSESIAVEIFGMEQSYDEVRL